ncbi:MAG: DNA polymerase, partial [Phycisphaeraceae bacterium]
MPQDRPPVLYLIDGHAQIFRAYYAIRTPMTSPVTGEPTHAVFGFAGMILKLFEQYHPHYVVMAIDMPGKTFRDELYDQYKATREPPPEDFHTQEHRIFDLTRLFGIPLLGQVGAEADDVIATVTQRVLDDPASRNVHIRIVSKDKDLEQLLGDRVNMFDIHTDTTIDAPFLQQNKGISPDQVVDVLALTGDKVDNIPGVDGVGPKTAAKLIQEYGSIDAILANLDKIKGKRRENLEKARDLLPLSRQLVTLKRDLDIPFALESAKVGAIDATALKRLFKEMGFRRHATDLDRLLNQSDQKQTTADTEDAGFAAGLFDAGLQHPTAGSTTTASECNYHAITTKAQLNELVATLKSQKIVSVDTETIGLGHRAGLCGICLAWQTGSGVYVPIQSPVPSQHLDVNSVLDALRPLLEDPHLPKCGHNVKYDILVLRRAGIGLAGVAFDSMIASHLLGHPGHGLDHLALSQLKLEMIPISDLIGPRSRGTKQKTMDQVPLEQITPYAAEDADIALQLYELFSPQLRAMDLDKLAAEVEMPLVEVLARMEFDGIKLDPQELAKQKDQLTQRIDDLRGQIHEAAGSVFNIDSPKQLADVLFKDLDLPVVKRTKTGPSTDIEVLEKLADSEDLDEQHARVPSLIVEYRQLTKLVSTYLVNL